MQQQQQLLLLVVRKSANDGPRVQTGCRKTDRRRNDTRYLTGLKSCSFSTSILKRFMYRSRDFRKLAFLDKSLLAKHTCQASAYDLNIRRWTFIETEREEKLEDEHVTKEAGCTQS
jgi:hypothetical protein